MTQRTVGIVLAITVVVLGAADLTLSGTATKNRPAPVARRSPVAPGLAALPAAARAVVAQRLGAADRRFWAHRAGTGATFSDPRTGIDAHVSRGGVVVRAGALSWSVGLRALGRGRQLERAGAASPAVRANQVALQRPGGIDERYAYGPLGLEQGFTMSRRPSGPSRDAVVLALGELPRGLTPVVAPDGRSLALERDGRQVLRYWGLFASDGGGQVLPARIALGGRRLSLRIDDRGARYPVRVDPFVQAGKLTASDGATNDNLGLSVAASGDMIVVGAPLATVSGTHFEGAAYVFVRPAGGWASATQVAKLTPSDGANDSEFGSGVAISGDTIAVGAPELGGGIANGAVYVFVKPVAGWTDATETAKLTASDGHDQDGLGSPLAMSADTIAAGNDRGAVYVFTKPVGGWMTSTQTAKLTMSDSTAVGSVAIDADTIAAGANNANIAGHISQGAVYVYTKPNTGWADATQTAKLTASDGTDGDNLGSSVGISGDVIAAGARYAAAPATKQGAVYVFVKAPGGWTNATQTAKLTASDGAANDILGSSVAISGDTIAAGAPQAPPQSNGNGAVYLFTKPAAGWANGTQTDKLTATDGASGDQFGYSAAITPDTVVAGAPHVTVTGHQGQGAAYVYAGSGGGGGGGPFTLTVLKTGTGDGIVTSTPAGIFCGAQCAHNFAAGTSVTLHVTPDSSSTFGGFSGDCSGTSCTVQITRTRSVTVLFTGGPRNIVLPSIRPDQSCQNLGRSFCRTIPYQYVCDPGQWAGIDPSIPYQFEWQQLYYVRSGGFLRAPFWRMEPNATSQTFYAHSHVTPFDIAHGYVASGAFRCVVTATGPGGSTAADSPATRLQVSPSVRPPIPSSVNIHVTGIEVTQGTQEAPCPGCVFSDPSHTPCATCAAGTLPSRDQTNGNAPGDADYSGVTMAAGKLTVVRVYANVTSATGSLAGATAQLQVFDSAGKTVCLPGAVPPACALGAAISPSTLRPPAPACVLCVDLATRANPSSSFYFLIPAQYTVHRSLSFRATVNPRYGLGLAGQCSGCRGNIFTLNSVPFKQPATVTIWPIPLSDRGVPGAPQTSQSLAQIFGSLQVVFPNPVVVLPWDGDLNVAGLDSVHAVEAVEDRAEDNDLTSFVYPVGVFFRGESGGEKNLNGDTTGSGTLFTDDGPPQSVVNDYRPLTGVAHEIGHGMALGHADDTHPHPDGSPDCGGESSGRNPQHGEGWPPDYEGRIQGVGLDLRGFSPLKAGSRPSTFVEGFDHQGNPTANPLQGAKYFDFMSYCPAPAGSGLGTLTAGPPPGPPSTRQFTEPIYWLSPHNWQRLLDYHAPPQTLPDAADPGARGAKARLRARATQAMPLRVIATVQAGGATTIDEVTPGARVKLRSTPGSPFRIELRDAAGRLLTSVVPATETIHVDGVGQPQPLMLAATLPFSPIAAAVAITAGGHELAHRTRSAHAPAGRFVSPRSGTRVGRTSTTVVRWSAHDADGDSLIADVDYSANGGRSWRVLASRVTGTSARIPSRLLSASDNARLRVRVSDGFNLTTVMSGRLRAAGAAPVVQIIGAPRRGYVLQTAILPLEGAAFDDAGRPLTGRHLTWYLGKRRIGRGEFATAAHLHPGNTTIRLVATDSHGRSTQAVLPLRVSTVAARYLLFDAPLLVLARARTVRIRVAASAPATFTIAGKRYAVGPRVRTITVRIRPGRSLLRLTGSLRSPGGVIKGTYIAVRGQ